MPKYTLLLSFVCFIGAFACKPSPQKVSANTEFEYQNGDLVFQDADCGSFCEAIEKVTQSYGGKRFSHVGLIKIEDTSVYVLEAVGKGVLKTPLSVFLQKSLDEKGKPKVMVGRPVQALQQFIPKAIESAESRLGKPYDEVFDIQNDSYYCSELIYFAFKEASGEEIFKLEPMTFCDPATKKTFGVWEEYYKSLGQPIPEGQPGLNPGGISRSKLIEIVHSYYF